MHEPQISTPHVTGTVSHIIFRNEENGYTVMVVDVDEAAPEVEHSSMTVIGHFPLAPEGELLTFFGQYRNHARYGRQFETTAYDKHIPQSGTALVKYLASERFPTIGRKTALRIAETLGEKAIERITEDPGCLQEVPGLKKKQASMLIRKISEEQELAVAMSKLISYGFGMDLATKIIQRYGDNTLRTVEDDPYTLVAEIEGIGFGKADRLGEALGIETADPKRIKAGLLFALSQTSHNVGHVYLPERLWVEETLRVLQQRRPEIEEQLLWDAIVELAEEGAVAVDDDKGYMLSLYFAEKGLATSIERMLDSEEAEGFSEDVFLQALGDMEEAFKITYAEKQKEAVRMALMSPLMILTGGPGTGKTTVIRAIVEMFTRLRGWNANKPPVLLSAPTGRAAKRMTEATGMPAFTIHRLLGWRGEEDEYVERDEENPFKGELLIVDEASMIDVWLANKLFKAVPSGMHVILVGDEDQLPSVGPGQILGDLLRSKRIPSAALSLVYRQAAGSSIVDLAHSIKSGVLSTDFQSGKADRAFFPCRGGQIPEVVEKICLKAIERGYSARDVQVLVPMYKGTSGIHALNALLQEIFNPPKPRQPSMVYGDVTFRRGDVVLQLVNNPEQNVFNGDRGEIVAIVKQKEAEDGKEKLIVDFDGIETAYERQELNQITLAYCSSIHKAQGSEFPIVIVPLSMAYRRMLKRNLLYTAITRARDYLIMVGEQQAFEFAVQNNDRNSRYTNLLPRLGVTEDKTKEATPKHNTDAGG